MPKEFLAFLAVCFAISRKTDGFDSHRICSLIICGPISASGLVTAEKRAQANVITRREEVASTRSLLNTAKLMDENQTLNKLKELEYVEQICENVGNINLNGNTDVLSQLTGILRGNTQI